MALGCSSMVLVLQKTQFYVLQLFLARFCCITIIAWLQNYRKTEVIDQGKALICSSSAAFVEKNVRLCKQLAVENKLRSKQLKSSEKNEQIVGIQTSELKAVSNCDFSRSFGERQRRVNYQITLSYVWSTIRSEEEGEGKRNLLIWFKYWQIMTFFSLA